MPNSPTGIPHYYFIAFELIVLALLIAAGFWFNDYARRCFAVLWRFLSATGRKRALAIIICALLPVLLRFALLPWVEVPKPAIMEEFSYLLSSDTFASGHLANPPHPMATHFQTFQVLQEPTYSSIRPPAQGLFMAAGQVLTGLPWIGVVISVALMCGSLCWMLQGWFPLNWAFLGGLLAAIRIGVFTYWMNSYWGGAVAALGACLVLGAAPRMRITPRVWPACLMGVGIFLLFTSRAYEGLFVLLPAAVMMASWLFAPGRIPIAARWLRFAIPVLLVLTASAAWMAYYNYRVTGSAKTSPYLLGRRERNVAPPFLWEEPGPAPVYHLAAFKEFYQDWELDGYRNVKQHYLSATLYRFRDFWRFYLRPAFTLSLIALLWVWRDRRMRLFMAIVMVAIIGQAFQTWFPTYYAAPVTGVVFAVVIQCLRHIRVWKWRGRKLGEAMVAAVCGASVAVFLALTATHLAGKIVRENETPWASTTSRLHERGFVNALLASQPGKQLAIVRYLPGHNVHYEWVFNRADIDGSKVVWARDLGAKENEKLLRYFRDRKAWLIEPDRSPALVMPYKSPRE